MGIRVLVTNTDSQKSVKLLLRERNENGDYVAVDVEAHPVLKPGASGEVVLDEKTFVTVELFEQGS